MGAVCPYTLGVKGNKLKVSKQQQSSLVIVVFLLVVKYATSPCSQGGAGGGVSLFREILLFPFPLFVKKGSFPFSRSLRCEVCLPSGVLLLVLFSRRVYRAKYRRES